MPDRPRRKDAEIKIRVEPELRDAFSKYCDRAQSTKSDILREYISFLLEHPEIESGKEMLEKMLAAYKASSPVDGVNESFTDQKA